MTPRALETLLARFTIGALVIYFPAETWASLPHGLASPFYLVDLVAMILLAWGAVVSLRSRPRRAPALLCAAYAWATANGWRATASRAHATSMGEPLDFGTIELWIVGGASAISLLAFGLALYLVLHEGGQPPPPLHSGNLRGQPPR